MYVCIYASVFNMLNFSLMYPFESSVCEGKKDLEERAEISSCVQTLCLIPFHPIIS